MIAPTLSERVEPASRTLRPRWRTAGGYILLETTVALVVLGAGSYAVHGAIRQALITRAQAQDYTHARFLLEQLVAGREIQPQLEAGNDSGRFSGEFERFSWEYQVRVVTVPRPSKKPINPAPREPGKRRNRFEYAIDYLLNIRATVFWTRAGQPFSESIETLFSPTKFWEPPVERDPYEE